jgi:hypothetical protein
MNAMPPHDPDDDDDEDEEDDKDGEQDDGPAVIREPDNDEWAACRRLACHMSPN